MVLTAAVLALGISLVPAPAAAGRAAPWATYSFDVWRAGGQAQIDACKGAVKVSFANGYAVIAQHNYCGGEPVLRINLGDLVILSGAEGGIFRAVRATFLPRGSLASALEGMSPDRLVLQTCAERGDLMRFVGLMRLPLLPERPTVLLPPPLAKRGQVPRGHREQNDLPRS